MKKTLATALIAMTAMGSAAFGEDTSAAPFSWGGVYLGGNLGGTWSSTCSDWTPFLGGVQVQNQVQNFINTKCPSNSAFTGGATLGINFVANTLMLGVETDYNGWSSSSRTHTVVYTGSAIPAGTYSFSGNESPNGFGTVRLRFGLVADRLMPYVTAGYAYAGGSPSTTIYYTPPGGATPTAVTSATRTLGSDGWTAGLGAEYAIASHFSMNLEWLYMQFGHGTRLAGACTNSNFGASCTAFETVDLNFTSHNSGDVNLVRLGANYLFNGP